MWRGRVQACCPAVALAQLVYLSLLTSAMPLLNAGPHVSYEWGESIRLRHLYTASRHSLQSSYFLQIGDDGRVDGTKMQTSHSLMEIRAVTTNSVSIKGHHSSLFLCMESGGKLRGLNSYSPDDCSFEEKLQPDGYNVYTSKKYGQAVSLAKDRHRPYCTGRCFLPLSHFLPMLNNVPLETKNSVDEEYISRIYEEVDPLIQLTRIDVFPGLENPGP